GSPPSSASSAKHRSSSNRLIQPSRRYGKFRRYCQSQRDHPGFVGKPAHTFLYSRVMNEAFFTELSAWLTQAGLAGTSETDIVSGLCDRCVAAGLPLARTQVFIDALHPVHEGRLFRWGFGRGEPSLLDYGRTSPDALAASSSDPLDTEAAERWRRSPFYRMLQT